MALLLTCPGVPDLYQGTEVWDLSLVDPDNRRPVDYARRRDLLGELAGAGPEAALDRAAEGGPKLWLIHRVLAHRRRHPGAYGPGSGYEPLHVRGPRAQNVVAFTRTGGLAVIVPRLVPRPGDDLVRHHGRPPCRGVGRRAHRRPRGSTSRAVRRPVVRPAA